MSSAPETSKSQSHSFSQGRPKSSPFKIKTIPFSRSRVIHAGGFTVAVPDYRDLYRNLGKTPICSIDRPTLGDDEEVNVELTEFRAVAAYNWADRIEPRIIVPGSPRIWHDQALPFTISKDKGQVFIDQNSCRLATSPLLPLIIAVNQHDPQFHMGEMDFITDRNSLRKLYRWVSQSSWTHYPLAGTFRIDVELVGKTILLQRWELYSAQSGGPGYERNFQEHMTSQIEETMNTTGHHRIVAFKLGNKQILMRCTTDACLPSEGHKDNDDSSVDKLASKLTSLNLKKTSKSRKIATFQGGFLTVQTGGKLCPQESIIELKTKGSLSNQFDYDDIYVQLLLANVSNIYTGRHHLGTFHTVTKDTLGSIEEKIGEAVQRNLKLLKKMLDEIQRVVIENLGDSGSLSLVLRKGDRGLEVLEREEKDGLLPDNILAFIH